ncbi:MAG: creatininase family protein [Ardenticatenaceae bacterium]
MLRCREEARRKFYEMTNQIMQPIYLTDLTWPEVETLLAGDDRLIIVTGATEQHGRHLPLGTDYMIPMTLAERLSGRSGVPIAPVLNIGMSEAHMAFAGTFTFTNDTLKTIYLEVIQSAYRNGWRRLFVLNGHGGNKSAWKWAASLAMKIKKDLKIYVKHWWDEEGGRDLIREVVGRNEGHAGLEESAAMLVSRPDLVQLDQAEGHTNIPEGIWSRPPGEVRATVPSGAIGENPAEASKELGEEMLTWLVEEYERLIEGEWV